jgi:conjugal transfer pilus assembly protein TraV
MSLSIPRRLAAVVLTASLGLAGCATEYACPVPKSDGGCRSVAQVYQDTGHEKGITPSAGVAKDAAPSHDDVVARVVAATGAPASIQVPGPGSALLSTPRVLRVLITPWQDSDGDLDTGGTLYLRLDRGQWTMSPQP